MAAEAPERKRYTFKEWLQGKPLGHPSHAMFVHFPVALYLAVIVFDVLSLIEPSPALVLAASYLLIGGAIGTALSGFTGLLDWLEMVPGSSKRKTATRHMLLQLSAAAFFIVAFAMRWGERARPQAKISWLVVEVIGYMILAVGQWLGGILVYQKGMRVRTGTPQQES